ncbi:MAG: hypothetical protein WCX73_03740 [Candidatus Pacearchaeota archaeon]|jgi:hypothetical protein
MSLHKLIGADEIDGFETIKQIVHNTYSMFKVLDFVENFHWNSFEQDICGSMCELSKNWDDKLKELESYEKAFDAVLEDYQ